MAKFSVRARAIDMLGRQQIAGIATAISELFKNAHDAYADSVEIDYFTDENLLILRDDGLGMTKEEFLTRWLVIGTESKLDGNKGVGKVRVDEDKVLRPILGEKGIGRLAIALLGPQVLVLTRAKLPHTTSDLVVSFINWGFFECPGLDIDKIEIPLVSYPNGNLPSKSDIIQLVSTVKKNLLDNSKYFPANLYSRIQNELDSFSLDPTLVDKFLLQVDESHKPSLGNLGTGTHFYIMPINSNTSTEIEMEINKPNEDYSKLRRLLLGFSNTMVPGYPKPNISTYFRIWDDNQKHFDIINEHAFFTPDEFLLADHRVSGTFDKFGNFLGSVEIYGEKTEFNLIWKNGDSVTDCKSFNISFAYIPGGLRDTKIPRDEFNRMNAKLNNLGGIYVYKDNTRILPYGDPDIDWLEIEKRRSKGAGYYFFSYRRIFGVINISKEVNYLLTEKAGREGFQENRAYKELREILINFFITLAQKFFRSNSDFYRIRDEKRKMELAKIAGEKERDLKRERLSRDLYTFFTKIDNNQITTQIERITSNLSNELQNAKSLLYPEQISEGIVKAEQKARNELHNLRNSLLVEMPSGIGLDERLSFDWVAFEREFDRIDETLLNPLDDEISKLSKNALMEVKGIIDYRIRIRQILKSTKDDSISELTREIIQLNQAQERIFSSISNLSNDLQQSLLNNINKIEIEYLSADNQNYNDNKLEELRKISERAIIREVNNSKDIINPSCYQLA